MLPSDRFPLPSQLPPISAARMDLEGIFDLAQNIISDAAEPVLPIYALDGLPFSKKSSFPPRTLTAFTTNSISPGNRPWSPPLPFLRKPCA
jgi:hypothetical protein